MYYCGNKKLTWTDTSSSSIVNGRPVTALIVLSNVSIATETFAQDSITDQHCKDSRKYSAD